MATQLFSRTFLLNPTTTKALASLLSRSFSTKRPSPSLPLVFLSRLRPLSAVNVGRFGSIAEYTVRGLATRASTASLNDSNPNWSNRPPKETILLDGCDFEHWLVVMEKPEGDPHRDEIIDSYIKTLAKVVGSEEEARMKIYSVSTRCYFAFGALVDEETSYKMKELPGVRWVLPDSYLDVKNKDYGGEPFINGQAVPYDPKYHEEWIRNNARANERNRRNDRPRNFDRSRNYERRRENMQNRDFQNQGMQNPGPNMNSMAPNNMPPSSNVPPANSYGGSPPANTSYGGLPPANTSYGGSPPNTNYGGSPPTTNYGGSPPATNYSGSPPTTSNYGGSPPTTNYGGRVAGNNYGGMQQPPPNNYGGAPQPPNSYGGAPQPPNGYGGAPQPPNSYGGAPTPPNSYGGAPTPPNGYGAPTPPNNYGGAPTPPIHGGRSPSANFNTGNMSGTPQDAGNVQQSSNDYAYQNSYTPRQ